ncbi:hypothetical protein CEXT_255541 [Caerostris extrusa]|uniref:Uncharacterized protein n=1 Tax=Caerostris extrusa TaxID=172846 RepID=A0AAV4YGH3_CAEEX|nr:hypothetical protein CEXT_255541 [Caerostris extrusa]
MSNDFVCLRPKGDESLIWFTDRSTIPPPSTETETSDGWLGKRNRVPVATARGKPLKTIPKQVKRFCVPSTKRDESLIWFANRFTNPTTFYRNRNF